MGKLFLALSDGRLQNKMFILVLPDTARAVQISILITMNNHNEYISYHILR